MKTISVSNLKAHLSAELKRVQQGLTLVVVDHRRPVALLRSIEREAVFVSEAVIPYSYIELEPLMKNNPLQSLEEERADSW